MSVITDDALWVVPPRRAVWIPALVKHSFRFTSDLSLRTLYIDPELQPERFDRCCVIEVSSLLDDVTERIIGFKEPYKDDSPAGRLVAVLFDELNAAEMTSVVIPRVYDARLLTIVKALGDKPDDTRTLAQWADKVGASERTLARQFRKDTGLSFNQWRQQLRLAVAMQLLAGGKSVTTVALELGYESTSGFIAMFRRNLGTTPSQYMSDQITKG